MNAAVYTQAALLAERAIAGGQEGFCEAAAEWHTLNADLGGVIPDWYMTLMASVPLAGLGLGGTENYGGTEWFDTSTIRFEATQLHPGMFILERGYFCVAGGNGTGDQLFISAHDGEDPPLYQISHETGGDADNILANGREIVASSLSSFFSARLTEAVSDL